MRRLTLGDALALRGLIRSASRASDQQRVLHRLHCALLIAEGRSCYEVARWFGEAPRTVERWVHAFERHGIDGLQDHRAGGRPAKLSREIWQGLERDLRRPPALYGYSKRRWTGRLLTQHLQGCYGVKLGTRQCQRLLRRLTRADPVRMLFLSAALATVVLSHPESEAARPAYLPSRLVANVKCIDSGGSLSHAYAAWMPPRQPRISFGFSALDVMPAAVKGADSGAMGRTRRNLQDVSGAAYPRARGRHDHGARCVAGTRTRCAAATV